MAVACVLRGRGRQHTIEKWKWNFSRTNLISHSLFFFFLSQAPEGAALPAWYSVSVCVRPSVVKATTTFLNVDQNLAMAVSHYVLPLHVSLRYNHC